MRSGQAAAITWDMIENDNVLRMPGFLTKSGEAYSLALTDESGKPYAETAFLVNMKNRLHGAPVFDMTNFQQARNSSWDGSIEDAQLPWCSAARFQAYGDRKLRGQRSERGRGHERHWTQDHFGARAIQDRLRSGAAHCLAR
jgi:hypothetical protein